MVTRTVSGPLAPGGDTVSVEWRDNGGLALAGALITVFAFVALFVGSPVELRCDRQSGTCTLNEPARIKPKTRTIALADIKSIRAVPAEEPRIKVTLYTTQGEIVLPKSGSDREIYAFTSAAATFFRTPSQRALDIGYGRRGPHDEGWVVLGTLTMYALYLLIVIPTIRISANRARGVIIFERRALRWLLRPKEYAASTILRAQLNRHSGDGGPTYHVVLLLVDQREVYIAAWAGTGAKAAQRLCDKVNAVLASVH